MVRVLDSTFDIVKDRYVTRSRRIREIPEKNEWTLYPYYNHPTVKSSDDILNLLFKIDYQDCVTDPYRSEICNSTVVDRI